MRSHLLFVRRQTPGLGRALGRDLGLLGLGLTLVVSGCLDRGGLDPVPDAGTTKDGPSGSDGSATGGATGTGTGGTAGGTGGEASTGGTTGTGGGTKGTGGTTATGGTKGTGGAIGSGGRTMTNTGGATGTGGATATGGAKGTGGTGGKTMCGAICDIYCPYGNVLDANGCPTCKCNPMPECPLIKCQANCPNGYVKDDKGCQTCTCVPDACTTADCGPMPATTTIACPASTKAAGSDTGGVTADLVAPPVFICSRDASGKCVWQSPGCHICPALPCQVCPNGYELGADGCSTCTCKPAPASACGSYTSMTACAADVSCRWLQPGCSEPALAAAGCFAKASLGCTSDASCGAGHQCLKRTVNPCAGASCTACAVIETICQ